MYIYRVKKEDGVRGGRDLVYAELLYLLVRYLHIVFSLECSAMY